MYTRTSHRCLPLEIFSQANTAQSYVGHTSYLLRSRQFTVAYSYMLMCTAELIKDTMELSTVVQAAVQHVKVF